MVEFLLQEYMILDKARLGHRETLITYYSDEPLAYFRLENYKISEHGQSGHRCQAGSVAIFSSISWRHEVCVSCLIQHLNLTKSTSHTPGDNVKEPWEL